MSPALTRRPAVPSRKGYTLLEMLVVMATMGIACLLGTAAMVGALRVQQGVAGAVDRLTRRSVLADEFRDDVARALETPETLDERRAGARCLILRQAGNRVVVYQEADGVLRRGEGTNDADLAWGVRSTGPEGTVVEFSRPGPGLVSLQLRDPHGKELVPRETTITAALGGNRR